MISLGTGSIAPLRDPQNKFSAKQKGEAQMPEKLEMSENILTPAGERREMHSAASRTFSELLHEVIDVGNTPRR